jgi:hypothetical protein
METMHLAPDPSALEEARTDGLVAMFEAVGLGVTLIEHCNDAGCPVCFEAVPARAA